MSYNIDQIRSYFPVLKNEVYGKTLIYFDSAASSQKPIQVLMKEEELHNNYYGNIHRGAHFMADKATVEYEKVRDKVKTFINAGLSSEIIFTKGTTESINLVASSFGEQFFQPGDEIIVTEMEHHANIVPWQLVATRKGARILKWSFKDDGTLSVKDLENLITEKTKMVAVTHVSNVLGTVNSVKEIIEIAHKKNVPVLVDGAQAAPHISIDVQEMNADFYVFSAHKMYGPNGVGILYGKEKWLEQMPPYQGGGEMISEVSFDGTTFNGLPYKFEAGTPHITGVIAFGCAIDLINKIGLNNLADHEQALLNYATKKLLEIEGMQIYGQATQKSGVISFNIDGIHPYDLGALIDKMGVAVRTGHLCADTVMAHYKIPGCIRISFGMYNTLAEIDAFISALNKVRLML